MTISDELCKPVTNINYRTPQEVFDIMSDRIRSALAAKPGMVSEEVLAALDSVRDITERAEAMKLGLAKYFVPEIRTLVTALEAALVAKPGMVSEEVTGANVLAPAAQFLVDRLDDFERDALSEDDGEYVLRQFAGHVSPAIERVRSALTPTKSEKEEGV